MSAQQTGIVLLPGALATAISMAVAGWSRRELAMQSGVSERFLAQLETGDGNISLRRWRISTG